MSYNVYSDSGISFFSFSVGDFGFGPCTSKDNGGFELNFSFINFAFGYTSPLNTTPLIILKTGPFNLRLLPGDEKNLTFSFINTDIFIDFLHFLSDFGKKGILHAYFGGFASCNWLLFENSHFEPKFYIFSTGLRLSYLISIFHQQFIGFELGYKIINNVNNVFLSIKFDLLAIPSILFIGGSF
jgi:hypothetical protein